ncbi:Cytochrome P450 94A2 [Bienertia sinuspersici]
MFELSNLLLLSILLFLPLLLLLFINKIFSSNKPKPQPQQSSHADLPKAYPIIGHLIAFYQKKENMLQWISNLMASSPSLTYVIHRPFGGKSIVTANPANLEHILKTNFPIYQKGHYQNDILRELLGGGIFNVDGEKWKFQRQVASHEFNTKSLRKFVETVVDAELSDRMIPILSDAANSQTVIDLQDILQRFAFDNICNISFGYDPEYLTPSLPHSKFATAFDDAVRISARRFRTFFPIIWKIRRFLNIGPEKKLKEAVSEVRKFANSIVKQKKQELMLNSKETSMSETEDLFQGFSNLVTQMRNLSMT